MIQAPGETDALLDQIVSTLVRRFNPRRVYLFGSRARGDAKAHSDYDLLIEIDETPEGVTITRQGMTWLDDFPGTEIQVHVRRTGQLELRKDDPGRVDWDVVREGKLLFSVDGLPAIVPSPPTLRIRERRPLPSNLLPAWLKKAEKDLYHARFHMDDPGEWADEICFLSQQSAEKFLKALLIAHRYLPDRTHDLVALLGQLRSLGVLLPDIRGDCMRLRNYAVISRYPADATELEERASIPDDSTSEEAHQALAAAERIAITVRAALP